MAYQSNNNRSRSGDELQGIGGWLILMAIGQIIGPLQMLAAMVQEYGSVPDGTFARFPLAFIGDAILRLSFVGLLCYNAYLFFNKRIEFPKMFIIAIGVSAVLPFAIGIWVTVTSGVNTLANFTGAVVFQYLLGLAIGVIWISYLLNSVRVRNTFVC